MTGLADRYAQREDVCGVFCDNDPEVTFTDERGITVHWCRECYEKPCSHCGGEIEDRNKRKGMCQDRRDEIRMLGGDRERGIEKEPESEQTTLLTDGGRNRRPNLVKLRGYEFEETVPWVEIIESMEQGGRA